MAELVSAALPRVAISTSSTVLPEISEHERFSTTVVNALLSPLIENYTDSLERRLHEHGYSGRIHFLHGGGGVMTGAAAQRFAGRLASSGVAAGAIASKHIALSCGFDNSMGLDIGGTSADLSIVVAGESRIVRNWYVDYGHPICFPSLEVLTIGAGGGSIAWVDDGGALRVGPQSAGALPGPACYGLGGTVATVTDAQLCLGRIGTSLAGGSRILEPARAVTAVSDIATQLGCSVDEAAEGILRVASAAMADALRLLSVRRGHDPRDFALVAFGGAGPLYAVELARDLGAPEVVVPVYPGATSALGCLLVDTRHDHSTMFIRDIQSADPYEVESIFLELESRARASLRGDHVSPARMSMQRCIEMRYSGQSRALPIALDGPVVGLDGLAALFHGQHRREFGFSQEGDAEVELYQLAVTAFGVIDKPNITPSTYGSGPLVPVSRRPVRFTAHEICQDTPVFERADLFPGVELQGPAVIAQPDSTTLLPPGAAAVVDEMLNLHIAPHAEMAS
jgi:N-methylhydantoinase A